MLSPHRLTFPRLPDLLDGRRQVGLTAKYFTLSLRRTLKFRRQASQAVNPFHLAQRI
jgi:hypothetical protein